MYCNNILNTFARFEIFVQNPWTQALLLLEEIVVSVLAFYVYLVLI